MNDHLKEAVRRVLIGLFKPVRACGISLPRRLTQHLHFAGEIEVMIDKQSSFRMQAHGHNIENNLYWHGIYGHEPETILPWIDAARRADVILDIGANTGLYSLAAASVRPSSRTIAFEPIPRIADLARENASLNSKFNIEICEAAVSDHGDTVTIFDPGGSQPSSASLKSDFLDIKTEPIQVKCITIDAFVRAQGLETVDLIKLDVEGAEECALWGMQDTLRRYKPDLFMEFLDDRPELVEQITHLRELGYMFLGLTSRGCVEIDEPRAQLCERNLLLTVDPQRYQSPR